MTAPFDPYHDWLGIPAAEQPPHHYRLLGLQVFEESTKVIDHAADRVMIHLRTLTGGPNGALSQKLLNEVAAARACLVDLDSKRKYDQQLRARLPAKQPVQPQVIYQQVMVPVPVPTPYGPPPTALPPMPVPLAPLPPLPEPVGAGLAAEPVPLSRISVRRRKAASAADSAINLVKIAVGSVGGLAIGILVIWIFARSDPFGLFQPMPAGSSVKGTKKTKVVVVERPAMTPGTTTGTTSTTQQATGSTPSTTNPTPSGEPGSSTSSGPTPADPPTTTPQPMPQPVEPAVNPPVPVRPATPVAPTRVETRRTPPTAEEQAAKLTEIKEIYKTEFENGTKPAGREAFTEFLIGTAGKLKSDPTAQFVLLREAYSQLLKAKDYPGAAEVVDRLDAEFALDPYKLRLHVLKDASTSAKLPTDRLAIVLCAMDLVDLAIRQQHMAEAGELARIAESQARPLSDAQLKAKVATMKLEVDKLAGEWAQVERARKTLAANSSDSDAALVDGRYRCLVEGQWSLGLPLLALSKDQQLGPAAQQDVAGPNATVSAAILADNWFEIARSNSELAGFYARARHWYQKGAESLDGLDKVRIQQKIEQIDAMNLPKRLLAELPPAAPNAPLPPFYAMFARGQSFDPVNLFQFVNPQALQAGGWSPATNGEGQIFSRSSTAYARVPAVVSLPREYQVRIEVRRSRSFRGPMDTPRGPFVIGLVGPKGPFVAVIDMPIAGTTEWMSFLNLAAAKSPDDNTTGRKTPAPVLRIPFGGGFNDPPPRPETIVCQVRRSGVTVQVDGDEICRFDGDLAELSLPKEWSVGNNQALFLGSHQGSYNVSLWALEPLPETVTPPPAGQVVPPGFTPPSAFPQN